MVDNPLPQTSRSWARLDGVDALRTLAILYVLLNWDILWSLSVEETFYLAFPLACRLLGRGRWLVVLLAAFVLLGPFGRTVLTHGNEVWQEYSYLGGMDAIALGCLTALLVSRRPLLRSTVRALTVTGLALPVICLGFSAQFYRLGLAQRGLGMTLLAIGACMLIAVAAETRWLVPRLVAPLLLYGRRSYEIYLTHMFVVFLCFHLFMERTSRSLRLIPILFALTILLSGLLGELVGRFFSEPANRLLRARFGDDAARLGSVIPGE